MFSNNAFCIAFRVLVSQMWTNVAQIELQHQKASQSYLAFLFIVFGPNVTWKLCHLLISVIRESTALSYVSHLMYLSVLMSCVFC